MSANGGERLEQVAREVVERALAAGAEDAEAWAQSSSERKIRVYEAEVESLSDAAGEGVGVRYFGPGGAYGYAYTTDLGSEGLAAMIEAARDAAAVADPDEHGGLPERCGATEVDELTSPSVASWSTERVIELAIEVERAARARDGISQVEDTIYSDSEATAAIANSRDFAASYGATAAWAYSSAFAGEGAELMTGLGLDLARGPDGLDAEAIGSEAAERALELAGARQPESRSCPVVLDSFVAASFIGLIGQTLSADAVQRGRSLFADRKGDEIASAAFVLVDDGTAADGPGSAPFDAEGSPAARTPLIEDGRLLGFLYDARTARKDETESTGNAARASYRSPPSLSPTNLLIEPGAEDLAALVRRAGDGLYVTDVAGLHSGVNPVSGTFSVGASGRLIEGGELGEPVREITIASDLVSMLRAVEAVGSPGRWVPFGGNVKAAPLLVAEMAVSGS